MREPSQNLSLSRSKGKWLSTKKQNKKKNTCNWWWIDRILHVHKIRMMHLQFYNLLVHSCHYRSTFIELIIWNFLRMRIPIINGFYCVWLHYNFIVTDDWLDRNSNCNIGREISCDFAKPKKKKIIFIFVQVNKCKQMVHLH